MYKTFFGLRENPFNINPDPRFLHLTPQTRDSLQKLTTSIQNRQGFSLLTGEVGTGKTTLINYVRDWLHQRKMPTAFVFNSHLGVTHLFEFILADFCVPVDYAFKTNMLLRLNNWLIERVNTGQTPVLIVDEAQGLSFELFEEIRLLLNLETNSQKLLQIILVGQPELEERLKRPELRLLRQRIALRCTTEPLTLEESCAYITDRLRIAGATGNSLFSPGAVEAVHFYSHGIPRVMNLLCEHSLINAYVEQRNPVQARMVEMAARDFLLDESRAATSRSSILHSSKSNLTVMQSILTKELEPSTGTEDEAFHEPFHPSWPSASPSDTSQESAPMAQNSAVATQDSELAASAQNLGSSFSLSNLLSTLPPPEANHLEKVVHPLPISSASDIAIQFVAEMKLNLPTVSPLSPLHLVSPHGANPSASVPKRSQSSTMGNRVTALNYGHRVPSAAPSPSDFSLFFWHLVENARSGSAFLSTTCSANWSRLLSLLPRQFPQQIVTHPFLRRCFIDFKRDWNAMLGELGHVVKYSIAFPEMTRSLLAWLQEPLLSKHKSTPKNETTQTAQSA